MKCSLCHILEASRWITYHHKIMQVFCNSCTPPYADLELDWEDEPEFYTTEDDNDGDDEEEREEDIKPLQKRGDGVAVVYINRIALGLAPKNVE